MMAFSFGMPEAIRSDLPSLVSCPLQPADEGFGKLFCRRLATQVAGALSVEKVPDGLVAQTQQTLPRFFSRAAQE